MTSERHTTDVVVIGAGPAGIAAAIQATANGASVVVLDEGLAPGGQLWRHRPNSTPPAMARAWLARLERSGAQVLSATKVLDVQRTPDGRFVVEAERGASPVLVTAPRLILATGARELFLPFPGWTLPGVIGVGAAQALLKSGARFAEKRVVIAGSGPLLLPVAAALKGAGARLTIVAEQAPAARVGAFAATLARRPGVLVQAVRYRAAFLRAPYRTGMWVARAEGDRHVERVVLTNGRRTETYACDLLCAAFGLVPNTELPRLLGCTVTHDGVVVDARQQTTIPNVYCAGEPVGIAGVEAALAEGEIAGHAASNDGASPPGSVRARQRARRGAAQLASTFRLREALRHLATDDTIVCRCEDVRHGAIDPSWTVRQAKLYTRAGMGPCQGRICGAAFQHLYGWDADTVRPPIEPVLLSTLLADAAPVTAPPDPGAR